MTTRYLATRLAAFAALGALGSPALAADAGEPAVSPGYVVTLGAGAEFGPRFIGSKRYGFSPVPSFDIRKADEPEGFSAPNDSLDYSLVDTGRFAFGPVANICWGRSRSDMPRDMRGIDTTSTVPELGGFAEFWLAPETARTRLEVRQGVGSHEGAVADLSADLVHKAGRVELSGGPRMSAATAAAMSRDFGVSASEAAANGLVGAHDASAGLRSVGAGAALKYDATDTTAVSVYGQYDRLVGDAASSPVTRRFGSPNQMTLGVGLTHAFTFGR